MGEGEGLLSEAHKCFGAWHPSSWGQGPRLELVEPKGDGPVKLSAPQGSRERKGLPLPHEPRATRKSWQLGDLGPNINLDTICYWFPLLTLIPKVARAWSCVNGDNELLRQGRCPEAQGPGSHTGTHIHTCISFHIPLPPDVHLSPWKGEGTRGKSAKPHFPTGASAPTSVCRHQCQHLLRTAARGQEDSS